MSRTITLSAATAVALLATIGSAANAAAFADSARDLRAALADAGLDESGRELRRADDPPTALATLADAGNVAGTAPQPAAIEGAQQGGAAWAELARDPDADAGSTDAGSADAKPSRRKGK
jgi:hypothetical protein